MTNLTKMHAVRRIAGIIVLFAIIGFSMTACDNGSTHTCSFSTTWSSNATTHYKQCSCGEKIDVENHVGNPCSVCGYNSGGSSSYSLNGVWENTNGKQVTVSGNTAIINSFGSPSTLTLDAINKNYVKIGDQDWRNLTSTGNLTWSGQALIIMFYTSTPNVATGTSWVNCTITMSTNGQTITITGSDSNGAFTETWTRKR